MKRLRERLACAPHPPNLESYYRARLEILLRSVASHGAPACDSDILPEGEAIWNDILDSGRPVVLIGLHLGFFELLHKYPAAPPQGRPFLVVTAPAFSEPLSQFMRLGREIQGREVVWNGQTAVAARRILRENGVLALMADQAPRHAIGQLTLWDGLHVPCGVRLFSFLALKGAVLVPVSTWIQSDGRSRLKFHKPLTAEGENQGVSLETQLSEFLELAVERAPEQWNWSYPGISIVRK